MTIPVAVQKAEAIDTAVSHSKASPTQSAHTPLLAQVLTPTMNSPVSGSRGGYVLARGVEVCDGPPVEILLADTIEVTVVCHVVAGIATRPSRWSYSGGSAYARARP